MALSYDHGAIQWLSTDVVNTTYVISGLTFQPKALRFWWVGIQSSTDATSTSVNSSRGMGFAVDTSNRRCCFTRSDDNAGNAICSSAVHNGAIAGIVISGSITALLDLSAIASDGFTAIVDDQNSINTTVFWEAWGGSDLTVAVVGDFATPAAGGTQATTATGLTAAATDQILFFAGTQYTGAFNSGAANDSGFCVGATSGVGADIVVGGNSDDGSAVTDTDGWCHSGECIGMIPVAGAATLDMRASLNSFDTDGFTLNYAESAVVDRKFIFLAMKGGQWKSGSYTIDDTAVNNTTTVSGLAFIPIGLNLMGRGETEQAADVAQLQDGLCLGCASSTTSRRSQAVGDMDNVSISEIRTGIQYDQILTTIVGTALGDCDLDAITADGFRIIVDTASSRSATEWQGYVAFGNVPEPPVVVIPPVMGQMFLMNA